MISINRRNFLKSAALIAVPTIMPAALVSASTFGLKNKTAVSPLISFIGDGKTFEPDEYLAELQQVQSITPIGRDRYGAGGAVEALEKKFIEIIGKESAIFMPSGTMANQLAVATLSGENTKVFVQDSSHLYRDEADAGQSVFNKRLMPLAEGETYFTAQQLQEAIEGLPDIEVFQSGIGAVSIENPVRRRDGRMVPLDEIKKISAYCRNQNIKLHLDGARIYMASAWSGISVKEFASYFDTVYISLYKYLGASGGAILCGDKQVIDKMPHLIKVHGGNMYGNWLNASMALHRLEGIEQRLKDTLKRAGEIVTGINKISGLKISALEGGTNVYNLDLSKETDANKMRDKLSKEFNIMIRPQDKSNQVKLMMNETMLNQSAEYVFNAFKKSI